jgi:hypothetical protein
VSVDGKIYSGDHVLIAVGGYPSWPTDIPGAEHGIDSDGFFRLESLPAKTVVVGAGYIAVEMAGILRSLGSDVTLIIRKDKTLRSFDTMISEAVTEELEHIGVKIIRNSNVWMFKPLQKYCTGCTLLATKNKVSLSFSTGGRGREERRREIDRAHQGGIQGLRRGMPLVGHRPHTLHQGLGPQRRWYEFLIRVKTYSGHLEQVRNIAVLLTRC